LLSSRSSQEDEADRAPGARSEAWMCGWSAQRGRHHLRDKRFPQGGIDGHYILSSTHLDSDCRVGWCGWGTARAPDGIVGAILVGLLAIFLIVGVFLFQSTSHPWTVLL